MTVKYTKAETIATQIGADFASAMGLQASIEDNRKQLVRLLKGRKINNAKAGGVEVIRFREALVKNRKGEPYAEQTLKNYCSEFIKAVNENRQFNFNTGRTKAKGAQTAPKGSSASASSIRLEVKGEPKTEELSGAFRKFFNKLKGQDQYAQLASFLLDGLDEFDGE